MVIEQAEIVKGKLHDKLELQEVTRQNRVVIAKLQGKVSESVQLLKDKLKQ